MTLSDSAQKVPSGTTVTKGLVAGATGLSGQPASVRAGSDTDADRSPVTAGGGAAGERKSGAGGEVQSGESWQQGPVELAGRGPVTCDRRVPSDWNEASSAGQPPGKDATSAASEEGPMKGAGGPGTELLAEPRQNVTVRGVGESARKPSFTRTLVNIGYTCFFNSVMQVLALIPQFVTAIVAQSLPPNYEDSSYYMAFLKLFIPAQRLRNSSVSSVVLDVTSVREGDWHMNQGDWEDFVLRLTTKNDAGYKVGDYADPSDLLDHFLSIVPTVGLMCAIDSKSTVRSPCACRTLPAGENTVRDHQ